MDRLDGGRLPFAENMVNLLISENLGAVTTNEVMRVLVPNGIAYIRENGKWTGRSKPWPADIDEWTHWMHGPDGNAVAADTVAGPPRRLKWIAAPLWSRSHDSVPSVTSMVSARGRLFHNVGTMERISHLSMAAGGGRVFFVDGDWREIRGKLHAFSAATGRELWTRQCSSWGWGHRADVFVIDGLVRISGFKDDFYYALDPKSGDVKHKVSNEKAFDNAHHHRCYSNKATPRFVMTWALDVETGDVVSRERLSSDHEMEVAWGRDQTVDTGVLSDLLVAHGRKLAEYELPAAPVFDGMAAAYGQLYLSTRGGNLTCYAGE